MTIRSALMALFTMPPHGGNLAGSTPRAGKPPLTEGKTRHRSRDYRPIPPPPPPPAPNYSYPRGMILDNLPASSSLDIIHRCMNCLRGLGADDETCAHCGYPVCPRNVDMPDMPKTRIRRG